MGDEQAAKHNGVTKLTPTRGLAPAIGTWQSRHILLQWGFPRKFKRGAARERLAPRHTFSKSAST